MAIKVEKSLSLHPGSTTAAEQVPCDNYVYLIDRGHLPSFTELLRMYLMLLYL